MRQGSQKLSRNFEIASSEVDPTIEFLWNQRCPGRDSKESRDWAIRLLEDGQESDAILRLAGITDSTWYLEPELVTRILHDLGREHLLDKSSLLEAYQREIVADYYAGLLDGKTLLLRGCKIYCDSDYESKYLFWSLLYDDAGNVGYCDAYPFHEKPFDTVVKQALAEHGFPEPPQQ